MFKLELKYKFPDSCKNHPQQKALQLALRTCLPSHYLSNRGVTLNSPTWVETNETDPKKGSAPHVSVSQNNFNSETLTHHRLWDSCVAESGSDPSRNYVLYNQSSDPLGCALPLLASGVTLFCSHTYLCFLSFLPPVSRNSVSLCGHCLIENIFGGSL